MNIDIKNKTIKVCLEFDCRVDGSERDYAAFCLNIPDLNSVGHSEYIVMRDLGMAIKLRVQEIINNELPIPKVAVR